MPERAESSLRRRIVLSTTIYEVRPGIVAAGATVSLSDAFVEAVSGSPVTISVPPEMVNQTGIALVG